MPDRENVIERLQRVSRYFKSMLKVGYDGDAEIYREHRESVKMALELLKEQETVEHALDVLRKNGWKEEGTCEKCPLLTAVSNGVHEMAQQFRMGGETNG